MTEPASHPRWLHPTPGRLVLGLLAVEGLLWLSERFQWFPFNAHKGWTVLITVATVGLAVILMLLWFLTSLVLRRKFQFSLRSLLVFTLVVAIASSWLGVEMKRARGQHAAVYALQKEGVDTLYDYQSADGGPVRIDRTTPPGSAMLQQLLGGDFFANVVCVSFDGAYTRVTNAELAYLKGLTEVKHLAIERAPVTDAGLEYINALSRLQWLYLDGTKITDIGLTHLTGLSQIQQLDLNRTQVTDAGLASLRSLTQLQKLDLCATQVAGEGLDYLGELPKLQELDLSCTRVTDAALCHLKRLTHLQELNLCGTNATDKGIKSLQKVLPNCRITH